MYKGDITAKEAFGMLQSDPGAVVLDVRTQPEWIYVGIPAVDRLVRVSWQLFPSGEINPEFVEMVRDAGLVPNTQIFCLCRSGQRSALAAQALSAAGYENCYNIADGFEGRRDEQGHRGTIEGWKSAGLPWVQH